MYTNDAIPLAQTDPCLNLYSLFVLCSFPRMYDAICIKHLYITFVHGLLSYLNLMISSIHLSIYMCVLIWCCFLTVLCHYFAISLPANRCIALITVETSVLSMWTQELSQILIQKCVSRSKWSRWEDLAYRVSKSDVRPRKLTSSPLI